MITLWGIKRIILRCSDCEDRIFNRVISDISFLLKEISLTSSDWIETGSQVESEIVRVVSPSTTEITKVKRLKKKRSLGS